MRNVFMYIHQDWNRNFFIWNWITLVLKKKTIILQYQITILGGRIAFFQPIPRNPKDTTTSVVHPLRRRGISVILVISVATQPQVTQPLEEYVMYNPPFRIFRTSLDRMSKMWTFTLTVPLAPWRKWFGNANTKRKWKTKLTTLRSIWKFHLRYPRKEQNIGQNNKKDEESRNSDDPVMSTAAIESIPDEKCYAKVKPITSKSQKVPSSVVSQKK